MPKLQKLARGDTSFGVMLVADKTEQNYSFQEVFQKDKFDLLGLIKKFDLVVLRGFRGVRCNPVELVSLAHLIGTPCNNSKLGTPQHLLLDGAPEIFVSSNVPPRNRLPPGKRMNESIPEGYQYPSQQGWHHDQSFLDDPPKVSILYGHTICGEGGETLYANTRIALKAIDYNLLKEISDLVACHAVSGFGRTKGEVKSEENNIEQGIVARHQMLQRCPFNEEDAIFVCDGIQMDFVDGPLQTPSGKIHPSGKKILDTVLEHITNPSNVYAHSWHVDDIVIINNFSIIHCATWFDSAKNFREVWRVTVD